MIYGYSDNLDKNYVSPPLSLYPLCTVSSFNNILARSACLRDADCEHFVSALGRSALALEKSYF